MAQRLAGEHELGRKRIEQAAGLAGEAEKVNILERDSDSSERPS